MTTEKYVSNIAAQNLRRVRPQGSTGVAATLYNPDGLDYVAIRQSYIDTVTQSPAFKSLTPFATLLMWLLIDNGLRVSEITDTRRCRVLDDKLLLIWQHKTSSFRSASHRAIELQIPMDELQMELRCNVAHRFAVYRLLLACGCVYHTPTRKRDCVTHLFRRLLALSLWQTTQSLPTVQTALGHRSVSSTINYLDEALRLAPRTPRKARMSHDKEVTDYLTNNKIQNIWQKAAAF